MALTYLDTAALMTDTDFNSRSRVACLHYASYINGEATSTPAHNTRMRWARETFAEPFIAVNKIMPALAMDAKVQEFGSEITDLDLQSAVETTVNNLF